MRLKFDPVAKLPECPDHSDRAHSLRLFAHRRAALLIANAFIQNHPDQLTETMRNRPDGFVVAETRNETTVDDLEDASFTFDGSIGGLIEKATHVPVPLRRARAVIHSRALFLSRACPYPRGEILGGGEGRCLGTHLGNDRMKTSYSSVARSRTAVSRLSSNAKGRRKVFYNSAQVLQRRAAFRRDLHEHEDTLALRVRQCRERAAKGHKCVSHSLAERSEMKVTVRRSALTSTPEDGSTSKTCSATGFVRAWPKHLNLLPFKILPNPNTLKYVFQFLKPAVSRAIKIVK